MTSRVITGTRRRLAALAVVGATAVVVSACGSDDSGSSAPASSSVAKIGTAIPAELVMPAKQFPAGYTVQEIPRDQLEQVSSGALDSAKGAKYKPASCVQESALPAKVDLDKVAVVVGMRGTNSLTVSVVESDQSLAEQRDAFDGKCRRVTVTFDAGAMAGASGVVNQKVIPSPKTRASDTLVVESTTTMTVGGNKVTTTGRRGYALVDGGYQVSVVSTSNGDAPMSAKEFNAFFADAVNHAVDAAG